MHLQKNIIVIKRSHSVTWNRSVFKRMERLHSIVEAIIVNMAEVWSIKEVGTRYERFKLNTRGEAVI